MLISLIYIEFLQFTKKKTYPQIWNDTSNPSLDTPGEEKLMQIITKLW